MVLTRSTPIRRTRSNSTPLLAGKTKKTKKSVTNSTPSLTGKAKKAKKSVKKNTVPKSSDPQPNLTKCSHSTPLSTGKTKKQKKSVEKSPTVPKSSLPKPNLTSPVREQKKKGPYQRKSQTKTVDHRASLF